VAVRGGRQAIEGVILHTDRGSTGWIHPRPRCARDWRP